MQSERASVCTCASTGNRGKSNVAVLKTKAVKETIIMLIIYFVPSIDGSSRSNSSALIVIE